MRKTALFLAATCMVGFFSVPSHAADDSGKKVTVTGVLIDQACGGKMMSKDNPEKAAEKHDKDCATKDACEKSGYAVISGKEMLKLDENGDKLAKEWLKKTDKSDDLKVTVEGTQVGDKIAVTSLTEAK